MSKNDVLNLKIKDNCLSLCDSEKSKINIVEEKILCIHCKRTKSNGIRCLGMCVADNDY